MVKKVINQVKETTRSESASQYDVVVIGGGPAGLMAAGTAGEAGARVLLLEKNEELGKKLLISGGGRCNFTNANPNHREFVSKFGKKGSFLFSPLSVFGVKDTIDLFNMLGVNTKVEAGFRAFPESDNSLDILDALVRRAKKAGVKFELSSDVTGFKTDKKTKKISAVFLKNGEEIKAKNFVLATGGRSHPETGSTGDGFKWLTEIGHKVTESNPSLVPIRIKEPWIGDFSGITLENVGVSVWQNDKKSISKKGRVLFTHVGLSGPTILNMSKDVGDLLQYGPVKIAIDFYPGVGLDILHEKFKKLFEAHANKKIKNLVLEEVPQKVFLKILDLLKIDGEIEMHSIFREERFALIERLRKFELRVESLLGYDKAIITSGGLDLSEVDFKAMGSKLYDNLYFAGDILDFDRPSGGFSLQLCWTTGYVAGKSSAK